jgi:hypothetical protein
LQTGIQKLALTNGKSSGLQEPVVANIGAMPDIIAEDASTQLSASASPPKPPSLDGKSVTSGATFALDEKESLRPDDSASIRATEDDDTLSAFGTNAAGSRVGSDQGARAFRDQFYEITERVVHPSLEEPADPSFTAAARGETDSLNTLPQLVPSNPQQTLPVGTADFGHAGFLQQDPDAKLVEALDSPKDRLFILRLEAQIVDFVKTIAYVLIHISKLLS